jgi:hypothetical protein
MKHPESENCPLCASPDYITLHSEWSTTFRIALVYNRRCADCGACYAPPASRRLSWASVVLGALSCVGGLVAAVVIFRSEDVEDAAVWRTFAGVFVLLAAAGAAFLAKGLGALKAPAPEPEPSFVGEEDSWRSDSEQDWRYD